MSGEARAAGAMRAFRQRYSLTQRELADMLQVSKRSVEEWEAAQARGVQLRRMVELALIGLEELLESGSA